MAPPDPEQKGGQRPRYRVLAGFLWITGGRLAAALIQALSLIIVARGTDPERFGVVAGFLGLVVVLQTALDLGVSAYALRVRAADPADPEVDLCLRIYRTLGLALAAALLLAGALLSLRGDFPWWWLLPLAVGMAVERQADMRLNLAVADGDTWKNSTVLVFRRALTLGITVWGTQAVGAVLAYGAGTLFAAVASWVAAGYLIRVTPGQSPRPGSRKALLRRSRPFWANSFMTQIRNLDTVVVGFVTAPVQAGYYGAISRSVSPLRMIGSSMAGVMLPAAVKGGRGDTRGRRRVLLLMLIGLGTGYTVLGMTAGSWVVWLLGENYTAAVPGFRLLLAGLALDGASAVIGAVMQGLGLERTVAWVASFSSVLALTAVALGGLFHGATGAAAGLGLAYAVQFVAMLLTGGKLFLDSPED